MWAIKLKGAMQWNNLHKKVCPYRFWKFLKKKKELIKLYVKSYVYMEISTGEWINHNWKF